MAKIRKIYNANFDHPILYKVKRGKISLAYFNDVVFIRNNQIICDPLQGFKIIYQFFNICDSNFQIKTFTTIERSKRWENISQSLKQTSLIPYKKLGRNKKIVNIAKKFMNIKFETPIDIEGPFRSYFENKTYKMNNIYELAEFVYVKPYYNALPLCPKKCELNYTKINDDHYKIYFNIKTN